MCNNHKPPTSCTRLDLNQCRFTFEAFLIHELPSLPIVMPWPCGRPGHGRHRAFHKATQAWQWCMPLTPSSIVVGPQMLSYHHVSTSSNHTMGIVIHSLEGISQRVWTQPSPLKCWLHNSSMLPSQHSTQPTISSMLASLGSRL